VHACAFECFIIIIIVVVETMRVREISLKRPRVIYPIVRSYSPQHALARDRIIGTYKHFYVCILYCIGIKNTIGGNKYLDNINYKNFQTTTLSISSKLIVMLLNYPK